MVSKAGSIDGDDVLSTAEQYTAEMSKQNVHKVEVTGSHNCVLLTQQSVDNIAGQIGERANVVNRKANVVVLR